MPTRPRLARPRFRAALALIAATACAQASAQADWPALRDVDLRVAEGSALDFSRLRAGGAAGSEGWIRPDGDALRFERSSARQRFLCASMVFNPENGGIPAKDEARALAQALARTGYNLVRLHYVDAHLMHGRSRDFDFDPQQLDRLQFLLAELKAAGLYWLVDGLTSNNGAYGDAPANRYQSRHRAKWDVLTGDAGFRHWSTLVDRLWGARNPYTGTVPLADPAMLGIILVNEGETSFMAETEAPKGFPAELKPLFARWLRERYGDDAGLRRAWGAAAGARDTLDGELDPPPELRATGPRERDFARFLSELEREAFQRMDAHVRARGFKGLTTAFDSWGFFAGDATRQAVATVDMHAYHALPSRHGQPGSVLRQDSLHDTVGRMARQLATARQWGKPFIVSEYGQPFWNRYRHEAPALLPAVAAHQGWSALCNFGETPIQTRYGPSPDARRAAIYPFGIGADPVVRAGEMLAAQLYRRGDVATSTRRIRLKLDPDAVFEGRMWRRQVPESLSRLAFVAPIGLDLGTAPAAGGAAVFDVAVSRASAGAANAGDPLPVLRRAGVLPPANRTRAEARLFETDTGELLFDAGARRIEVSTPRTAALVLESGGGRAGALEVRSTDAPALFAVSALDDAPVPASRRLLVWVLTDAVNTGMSFRDPARTTLNQIGTFPPRVQPVAATLRIRTDLASRLKAWPLALNGQRRAPLPVKVAEPGVAEIALDTAKLPDGPALFFELAAE